MININIKKQESITIPLSGIRVEEPVFEGDVYIAFEKSIGGQRVQMALPAMIDKCNNKCIFTPTEFPKNTKEGQYVMRVYIREIKKEFLTLCNIKDEYISKRNSKG